jgi:hypothetical protein
MLNRVIGLLMGESHRRRASKFSSGAVALLCALLFGAECLAESEQSRWAPIRPANAAPELTPTVGFSSNPTRRAWKDAAEQNWVGSSDPGVFHAAGEEGVSGGGPDETTADAVDLELMAKKSNNPLSDVWLLVVQNDLSILGGDDVPGSEILNVTLFQPVMPVPVFDNKYNLIFRPVLPVVSSPLDKDVGKLFGKSAAEIAASPGLSAIAADPYGDRSAGLGDLVLLTLFGPNTDDGWVYGAGLTQIIPTATENILGQQKWQAGPAALVVRLGKESGGLGIENWNIGALAQQWFSYAGNSDREAVNRMNIQYFLNWKVNAIQLIGMTPNIIIDWKEKDIDDAVSLPIGLGTIGMFKFGKLPIRWGVEAQYYIVQSDASGPRFNFRVFFAPIISNPLK